MVNFTKFDFNVDFNFDEQILKTVKIEEIKQMEENKLKDIRDTKKRAGSQTRPVKSKKGKEDCVIF